MKKLLTVALFLATTYAFSQNKNLVKVYLVKPKLGQTSAYEAAWKAHVAKYHNTEDKVDVFEVLTGPNAGNYYEVHRPMSFADMDKEHSNQAAHDLDWEKTVATKLEYSRGPMIMSLRDSLSFNTNIQAEMLLVHVYNLKNQTKMPEFIQEIQRTLTVQKKRNVPFGASTAISSFAGSEPAIFVTRTLKDGFKELEPNYFNRPPNEFRDMYIKEFGQAVWNRRITTFLDENTRSNEEFVTKLRKDLSSKQ